MDEKKDGVNSAVVNPETISAGILKEIKNVGSEKKSNVVPLFKGSKKTEEGVLAYEEVLTNQKEETSTLVKRLTCGGVLDVNSEETALMIQNPEAYRLITEKEIEQLDMIENRAQSAASIMLLNKKWKNLWDAINIVVGRVSADADEKISLVNEIVVCSTKDAHERLDLFQGAFNKTLETINALIKDIEDERTKNKDVMVTVLKSTLESDTFKAYIKEIVKEGN